VKDKPASSLILSLGKALNGTDSNFEWLDGSNRSQLGSKNEKVTSLSPGRVTLTNKWVPKSTEWTEAQVSVSKNDDLIPKFLLYPVLYLFLIFPANDVDLQIVDRLIWHCCNFNVYLVSKLILSSMDFN